MTDKNVTAICQIFRYCQMKRLVSGSTFLRLWFMCGIYYSSTKPVNINNNNNKLHKQ
jgi:hypothetical protein